MGFTEHDGPGGRGPRSFARGRPNNATGIGFLGAGIIFVRNQTVSGLTTAAGVWGTAGVGMAVGAGHVRGGRHGYGAHCGGSGLYRDTRISNVFRCSTPDHSCGWRWKGAAGGWPASPTPSSKHTEVTVLALRADENNGRAVADITLRLPRDYSMAKLLELMDGHPCVKGVEL